MPNVIIMQLLTGRFSFQVFYIDREERERERDELRSEKERGRKCPVGSKCA
jgi:hypothetical protein